MRRALRENDWRNNPLLKALCDAFLRCRNAGDVACFLRDVATLYELQALSARLEAARLIGEGFSYREIADRTGLSSTTVTRVAWFLKNGEGYKSVLRAASHHHSPAPVRSGRRGAQ